MAAAVIQQQPGGNPVALPANPLEIGAEHNTTIVFPLPIDLITSMTKVLNGSEGDRFAGGPGTDTGRRNFERHVTSDLGGRPRR